MLYRITHTTRYSYSEPVSLCHNLAHLVPRTSAAQTCLDSSLQIEPTPALLCTRNDYYGNPETFFIIEEPHQVLTVTALHRMSVVPPAALSANGTPPWNDVRDRLPQDRSADCLDAYQFVFDSPYVPPSPALKAYAESSFPQGRPLLEAVLDLTSRIHADFRYDPTATSLATPLSEVFERRRGVCQDFAHLGIACLRAFGLAARYVSGYLCTSPPPGQRRLVGADASHAWLSVYCPGMGWLDVDPTNNVIPADKHILLAWGRDYDDVSPIKGVILGGGKHSVRVAVDVVPVEEGLP